MQIAVFKPKAEANGEGSEVWGKLHQKVISPDELDDHEEDGWYLNAQHALLAAETGSIKAENASLSDQIHQATLADENSKERERLQSWADELAALDLKLAAREDALRDREDAYWLNLAEQARTEGFVEGDAQQALVSDQRFTETPQKIDLRTKEGRAAKAAADAAKVAE